MYNLSQEPNGFWAYSSSNYHFIATTNNSQQKMLQEYKSREGAGPSANLLENKLETELKLPAVL
jgi:hypothetical protein